MPGKIVKIMLGLGLVPFCVGFTWQLGATVFTVTYKPYLPYYFFAGGLTYLTAHLLFKKPILTYVFGHELTHAFFVMIFGGSVKSFHAGERGGSVRISKSNVIITLAPYFFPLYTFIILVFYWVSRIAEVRGAESWLVFFSGATFTFHLILTFMFLQTDQNDIREHGAVFSYTLIYLFNVIFAALLVRLLLAKNMVFLDFLKDGIINSISVVLLVLKKVCGILHDKF